MAEYERQTALHETIRALRADLEAVTRERDEAKVAIAKLDQHWLAKFASETERAEQAERERDEARRERDAERERCIAWVDCIDTGCGCCQRGMSRGDASRGIESGAPAPKEWM